MSSKWDEYSDKCPECGTEDVVLAFGDKKSPILIIGEYPEDTETIRGIPFTGSMGVLLKQELAFLGIDLNSLRRCNLWIHVPNKKAECKEHSQKLSIQETKGKQIVLLIGSDVVKFFTGEKISEVNGLQVQSDLTSAPVIMACVNPSAVFKNGVGELRFALREFVNKIEELKL